MWNPLGIPATRGFVYICCRKAPLFKYLPDVVVDSIENLRIWDSFEKVFVIIK
jgi:hypothetical protein